LESVAITEILALADSGKTILVSSQMAEIEIVANPDDTRRRRVMSLLPDRASILKLTRQQFARAEELGSYGFKPADATHVAAAEALKAEVLLTCDDRLCRAANRHRARLRVKVVNPVQWLQDRSRASHT
jgi:predicted nucleic acid-binding protein